MTFCQLFCSIIANASHFHLKWCLAKCWAPPVYWMLLVPDKDNVLKGNHPIHPSNSSSLQESLWQGKRNHLSSADLLSYNLPPGKQICFACNQVKVIWHLVSKHVFLPCWDWATMSEVLWWEGHGHIPITRASPGVYLLLLLIPFITYGTAEYICLYLYK